MPSGGYNGKICFLLKATSSPCPLTSNSHRLIPCSVYLFISFLSSFLQRREKIRLIRLALDLGWDTLVLAWRAYASHLSAGIWPLHGGSPWIPKSFRRARKRWASCPFSLLGSLPSFMYIPPLPQLWGESWRSTDLSSMITFPDSLAWYIYFYYFCLVLI